MHTHCGHLIDKAPNGDLKCNFCLRICNAEVERTFHLKITVADDTAKVFAWCIGQTAAELLQISPDEFYELPEVRRNQPKNLCIYLCMYTLNMYSTYISHESGEL